MGDAENYYLLPENPSLLQWFFIFLCKFFRFFDLMNLYIQIQNNWNFLKKYLYNNGRILLTRSSESKIDHPSSGENGHAALSAGVREVLRHAEGNAGSALLNPTGALWKSRKYQGFPLNSFINTDFPLDTAEILTCLGAGYGWFVAGTEANEQILGLTGPESKDEVPNYASQKSRRGQWKGKFPPKPKLKFLF